MSAAIPTASHYREVGHSVWHVVIGLLVGVLPLVAAGAVSGDPRQAPGPYDQQVAVSLATLASRTSAGQARAAESLGFLRAFRAEPALLRALREGASDVRRQAAMALAWCGGRAAVPALLDALEDKDWFVRQAARGALENLTGLEFPFDATAAPAERAKQATRWRDWWRTVPADLPPREVLALLAAAPVSYAVKVSSAYKGPPEVLVDGQPGPGFWQTKNVLVPQWCEIDLGESRRIAQVTVLQYGKGFCLTDYELATSLNGTDYQLLGRKRGLTPVRLEIRFPAREARFVRLTSHGSEQAAYPTTIYEITVGGEPAADGNAAAPAAWQCERGLRALGALGGAGASEAIRKTLGKTPSTAAAWRGVSRAGLRALGRLGGAENRDYLVAQLQHPYWARVAAEALGDLGDSSTLPALLAAYERFAKRLDGENPAEVPADDLMSFPSEDRMLETPYFVAHALTRLTWDNPAHRQQLQRLAPRIMANLPGDHDTFILYEPEAGHRLTRRLLELAGLRQEACEQAMTALGQPRRVPPPDGAVTWPKFPAARMATWLPAVATEREDVPRLLALLGHPNHWVRLNAAKTLGWLGDARAIEPLGRLLAETPAEADFGYSGVFKDEEYNDPAPRWREGLVRALGLLGAREHTGLLARIMNDEKSVLEVRRAAADALAGLDHEPARAALRIAAASHDYLSIRAVARDALRARGDSWEATAAKNSLPAQTSEPQSPPVGGAGVWDALVFIKGDNDVPNTPQTVEQADRWRQTYAVTDEGPTYRPGNNLFVLRPARPDGRVTPLTTFAEGYVADPEVSWDGTQVVFCHRGKQDPWWQIYTIGVDGTGLRQLTRGPYHSVGPAWLPDGRIIFGSSRLGVRDEYHGYLCTALCAINADGTGLVQLASNIGRDNEPAVLPDGRIVFSRLEVFYSRNKTELTLHAMHPDGTQDVVLYGPERRRFWRQLDHGAPDPADVQEAPLTHRVLRVTQPQPMPDNRQIVVATQGGLTLVGPSRDTESLLCPDFKEYAYTTPYPLPDGQLLCSVTYKTPDRKQVDLGIYRFDPATGRRELVYNDPATADYEARPILSRTRPAHLAPSTTGTNDYSGRFLCASVFNSQEPEVQQRGRWIRVVEGVPQVGRHATQTTPDPVWKNHGGTLARVLGTAPLMADGSFFVEVPADRLLHLQVLDSDRKVVGNQLTWIYPRPGETKSCVGCHEPPATVAPGRLVRAAHQAPLDFLPRGDEFRYRAKAWFKGSLPSELEERTRTVHAVNLLAR